jgi:hypothetical protein
MSQSNNAINLINAMDDIIRLMNDNKKISRRAIERLIQLI